MKKHFLDDLPYKLISIVVAIIIWYIVVKVNDPIVKTSFEVPVQVTNEAYIASGKKTYQIEEYYQTVLVTVSGNSSSVNRISANDLVVTADMTQIVDMETNPVYIPLKVSCKRNLNVDLSTASATIPIRIENVDSAKFPIMIDTGNTRPAKNYEIGSMHAFPENVTVSGPESLIHKISSVIATVDVSDMGHSGTVSANLTVIDKNQDLLSESQMEFLSFDSGSSSVAVEINLWKKKADVGIQVEYSGVPANGYQVEKIYTTPEKLTVSGTDQALAELAEAGNTIIIPADMISVDNLKADKEFSVDLEAVLADHEELKIASGSSSQITVHVAILSLTTKGYSLDVDQIQFRNLPKTLAVSFDSAKFEVRVRSKSASSTLQPNQIQVALDCSNYSAGDYNAELLVTLPDGYELAETPSITIHLKESADSAPAKETLQNLAAEPVLPVPVVIEQ